MTPSDIQAAFEARQSAVHQLRELADETRGRDMTAEEQQTYDRQNTDIDNLDSVINEGLRTLERERKAVEALETFRGYNNITSPTTETAEAANPDDETLFRGDPRRSHRHQHVQR